MEGWELVEVDMGPYVIEVKGTPQDNAATRTDHVSR